MPSAHRWSRDNVLFMVTIAAIALLLVSPGASADMSWIQVRKLRVAIGT
jgi:hypothetical protein